MFCIHGHLLPYCSDYEGAVKVYENAHQHPRFDGWRGLKDKRDTSKTVCMTGTGAVVFRYHHTDMIIWEPNRVEINLYDSRSSSVFLDRFLPDGLTTRMIKGEMYIMDRNTGGCYMPRKGPLVFTYDGKWSVDVSNVYRFDTQTLDRKRAAEIRKIVSPFLDWWDSMERLGAPIKAERVGYGDVLLSLKTSISKGAIPEEHYRQLAANLSDYEAREALLRNVYVLGGAVTKQITPLGAPRHENKYEELRAWNYV